MQHITGTENSETIIGTFGLDQIDGAGGNDTLYGMEHRDTLFGGDGDDLIITGAGPDLAYGGDGNDVIIDDYTSGVEILYGGNGDDVIRSLMGAALGPFPERTEWWMFGDNGNDRLQAGDGGTAHLFGGADDDILMLSAYGGGDANGGSGRDRLYSEDPAIINDEAEVGDKYGSGGVSVLNGGADNDVLWGYSANVDIFVFKQGDGRDVIRNFGTGDWQIDSIDLTDFDFNMSAIDFFDTHGTDQGDRVVLTLSEDSRIIIYGAPYDAEGTDLAQAVIESLIL